MKRLTALDVIGLTVVIILISFTLAPAIARIKRTPAEATCQGNMRILANAMAEYCADYGGAFPINRLAFSTATNSDVPLSTPNQDGTLQRFQYGTGWVEELYPYIWAKEGKISRSYKSVFVCPNAAHMQQPANSNAAVTYAFNANLVEHSSQLLLNPNKLMMIRELDRLYNSVLRPSSDSKSSSGNWPISPFLDTCDEAIGALSQRPSVPCQHTNGSYILFADGHVSFFTTDYFPNQHDVNSANCWDTETRQWWNYNNNNTSVPDYMRKTIAITP